MFKDGAYYNGIGPALKEHFGMRMVKTSIDGGFTCPNRDGTSGYGGCIFCSEQGSGDFTGDFKNRIDSASIPDDCNGKCASLRQTYSILDQMNSQLEVMSRKWKDAGCLAYFQSYTNTYAPVSVLREKFEEALSHPLCKGICIATRPDCLEDDIIEYLAELNERTFVWVELGLQTIHDETAAYINRGCSLADYDDAVDRLTARGIRVVTHLIFGLPGESRQDMLASVAHVCSKKIYGIKIQLLHIMKGTVLGDMYLEQTENQNFCDSYNGGAIGDGISSATDLSSGRKIVPMTKEQYISYVADALEIIPPDITVHRLTGDAPRELLIEPQWSRDKKSVLNGINMELKRRGTWQGAKIE